MKLSTSFPNYFKLSFEFNNLLTNLNFKTALSGLFASLFLFLNFGYKAYAQTTYEKTVCGFNVKTEVFYNTPVAGQTTFKWTVYNTNPGNGSNGTFQDLSHWSQELGTCVDPEDHLSGGSYGTDPSQDCLTGDLLKFNSGTSGSTPVVYTAVFDGLGYAPILVDAVFKAGNDCCVGQIYGVGCCVIDPGEISGTDPVCYGDNPGLLGSAEDATGNGNVTYQWQSSTTSCTAGFTNIDGATDKTYDPPANATVTTYYRRVATNTLTGGAMCSENSNCVTVTVNPLPTVTADDKKVCEGNNSVTLTGSPAGGTWSSTDAPGAISGSTFNANGLAPGSYTVIYTYTDANTCTNTDEAEVEVIAAPAVYALTADDYCIGEEALGSVTLANSQTGVSYKLQVWNGSAWDDVVDGVKAGSTGSALTWSGLAAGTYQVVATGAAPTNCTSISGPATVDEEVCYEGCTPGYWKNHTAAWAQTGYTTSQTLESVFDVPNAYGLDDKTLLQALDFGGGSTLKGAASILLRAAVAALLNAAHSGVEYPRTTSEIIAAVNAALASGSRSTMLSLASSLDADNNLGCPLGNVSAIGISARSNPVDEAPVTELKVSASPNPYTDQVKFVIESPVSGHGNLEVFNMLGQKVQTVFEGQVNAGKGQVIEYRVPLSLRSNLIYVMRVGKHSVSGKLVRKQ